MLYKDAVARAIFKFPVQVIVHFMYTIKLKVLCVIFRVVC